MIARPLLRQKVVLWVGSANGTTFLCRNGNAQRFYLILTTMNYKITLLTLFLFSGLSFFSQAWKTYPYTPAGSLVSFPLDEGRHSAEPSEWWYTIGHVTGATTGKHYSYMLTYFYYPYGSTIDGFRILNISDDDNHIFNDEMKLLSYDTLDTTQLNISASIFGGGTEFWRNKHNNSGAVLPFEYEIQASSAYVTLDLDYNTVKRPLILGDSGFLFQGASDYTYYYSETGIDITGTITYNGVTENISGLGWIDRQYGSLNPSNGTKYEWFALQLSNGMDINLWNIFTQENTIPNNDKYRIFSSYVNDSTQYTTSDFELERLSYAYTPDHQKCYAQSWRLTSPINNVDLVVSTLYSNSEVQSPFRFFEGATTISGTVNGVAVTGKGFAELLHTYEVPDISIVGDSLWNNTIPFNWQLNNPDEGNPLKYKLEYSTDNQNTFTDITNNLTDTTYTWNTNLFSNGDTFWLKVTGFSIDGTIVGDTVKEFTYNDGVGVIELNDIGLSIYPNPASETVTITANNVEKISILDVNGKLIRSITNTVFPTIINIKDLEKGSYFVTVFTAKGQVTKKLVVR